MATSVGEIGLDLVVNKNGFEKQMSGITGLAKKAGAALAGAFAVKKLVAFGKEAVELGSALTEVQNVVDVTFPHMTKQIEDFSKGAASTFGMSETMAKRFTGTFGSMAQSFGFSEKQAADMSTTLTRLSGDVASFYDTSQDEAYTKLKSVFTGETESLKELGVVMTQNALDAYAMANGYGKTTAQMSEAEKVALRYAFVQEKLAFAQGDFARTSDSWANQVRLLKLQFDELKTSIGQGLIAVLTPVIRGINKLLGKLNTLASAFKSFANMVTGKKSSGGGNKGMSAPMDDLGSAAGNAGAGLSDASSAATGLGKATDKAGKKAKKAAKEMRSLMGFDQINKLTEKTDTDDDDTGTGTTTPGTGVPDTIPSVDYGSMAQGETVVDKMDGKLAGLINRAKELAGLFEKGFKIGFGDSLKRIDDIKNHLGSIGKTLKEIFTDPQVVASANHMFDSIALNAGKVAGSIGSVGVTIAQNLIGGIDRYLLNSKDFIKDRLVSIFDVTAEISDLVGDFSVALADIFSVFGGENGQRITASIIGIFSDAFLGAVDLAGRFARDVIDTITTPIVENKDKIKEAIDNTLSPIAGALETLHHSVKDTFEKISEVYDEHIAPLFHSLRDGISEIIGSLLDGYNEYIAPVLDRLSAKFTEVWQEHVQPMINKAIDLFGKVADLIKAIWENVLQPVLNWFAQNVMPAIAPVLEFIGSEVLDVFGIISDVVGDVFDILGDVIDFLTDVFKGDWSAAWEDVKDIFKDVWNTFEDIVRKPINAILYMVNKLLKGVQTMVNGIADMLNSINIDLPGWLEDLTGYSSFGFNLDHWRAPQIPYLAQGGFVQRNTPQLAMIGDNRHQGEVVAPEDKMQDMVNAAVKAAGSMHNDDELIALLTQILRLIKEIKPVKLDPETMRKYFIEVTNEITKSRGKPELLF